MVEQMVSEDMPIRTSCQTLQVSRSGYYAWLTRPGSEREAENAQLTLAIVAIHTESRRTYGVPRICAKLKNLGKKLGKNRVSRLMKKSGISGLVRKRFVVKTTDSKHSQPIADRIFKAEEVETHPIRPNQIWASDISYVLTDEGYVFIATYLDLYLKKVVGFAIEDHMRASLLVQALNMALGRQEVGDGSAILIHSDRGTQYASEEYREYLTQNNIVPSMSRKGNCYDNSSAESFFATLKRELVYRNHYRTRSEAKKAIFEYIEVWYNRERLHSSIGFMSPVQFENLLAA